MPPKPPNKPDPHAALATMQQGRVRGRGRRSPIIVWMEEHRVVLEQGFAKSAPDWSGFAAYLADHGVLDGDGKRPTAEATRQAWYRTKNMAAAAKPSPRLPVAVEPSKPSALPAPTPIQPRYPAPAFDATEGADETPALPSFGISKLRRD